MNQPNPPMDPTSRAPSGDEASRPPRQQSYFECAVCGYEPPVQTGTPELACPKCYSREWRVYPLEHVSTAAQTDD